MEDLELIQLVLGGKSAFYADLIKKYQTRVLQLCTSLLKDPAQADDAAQEIFFKAYESLSKFRLESSFATWIYRITSNHCLDLLRKRKRQKTQSWDQMVEQEGEKIYKLLQSSEASEQTQDQEELVHKVLSYLSPDYRLILDLREIQGLSYEEITQVLNCSLDSVKAKLRRAREDFKDKLRHFSKLGNV